MLNNCLRVMGFIKPVQLGNEPETDFLWVSIFCEPIVQEYTDLVSRYLKFEKLWGELQSSLKNLTGVIGMKLVSKKKISASITLSVHSTHGYSTYSGVCVCTCKHVCVCEASCKCPPDGITGRGMCCLFFLALKPWVSLWLCRGRYPCGCVWSFKAFFLFCESFF